MRQVERQRIQVAVIAIAVLVSLLGVRHARADGGGLRWQDRVEGPGGSASAASLAVHGGRAFASGLIINATGNADSLLRAYDLRTGEVLWWDQFDGAGGSDAGWAVAATDDAVFTAIQSAVGPGNSDWVVRAHDAANGALLWQNRYDRAGRTDRPVLMVAHDGEVF